LFKRIQTNTKSYIKTSNSAQNIPDCNVYMFVYYHALYKNVRD